MDEDTGDMDNEIEYDGEIEKTDDAAGKMLEEGGILTRLFFLIPAEKDIESAAPDLSGHIMDVKYHSMDDVENAKHLHVAQVKMVAKGFCEFLTNVMVYRPVRIDIIKPDLVHLEMDQIQSLFSSISEISQTYAGYINVLMGDYDRAKSYKELVGDS